MAKADKKAEAAHPEAQEAADLRQRLLEEIAGREKAEKAVQELRAELRAFSQSLVHDLRAPLRAIHGFAELVIRECGVQIGPRSRDYLDRILQASERMDCLIRDVLACGELRQQPVELRRIDVEALLRNLLGERPEWRSPSAAVEIQSPLPAVCGHSALLAQSFAHLLDNAVKFVAPGVQARVRVWGEPLGGRVRLWIEDNGIGIPGEDLPRVFEMFQQMHRAGSYPGTGIGLAIVRRAVERMEGQVGVESEPSKGSRFWVELRSA